MIFSLFVVLILSRQSCVAVDPSLETGPTTTTSTTARAVAGSKQVTSQIPSIVPTINAARTSSIGNDVIATKTGTNTNKSTARPSSLFEREIYDFVTDLDKLESLKNDNHDIALLKKTHTNKDRSYTRVWTNEDWEHHQVRSFWRYPRHAIQWFRSPTAHAVLPTVGAIVVWSALITWIIRRNSPIGGVDTTTTTSIKRFWASNAAFSSGIAAFTAPISLLLALKTNRALNRLLEARSEFGNISRSTIALGGLVVTYIAPHDPETALLIGRYLSLFGWAMKALLREEEDTALCQIMLPNHEGRGQTILELPSTTMTNEKNNMSTTTTRITNKNMINLTTRVDRPTQFIFAMRQLIATRIDKLPITASQSMEAALHELEVGLGFCKRMIATPIPPTYTTHTSRVLCIFLALLPVALATKESVSFSAVLVTVALLSYVFIGIDEIGLEIEHPFPLLPLFHIASTIQNTVRDQYLLHLGRLQQQERDYHLSRQEKEDQGQY